MHCRANLLHLNDLISMVTVHKTLSTSRRTTRYCTEKKLQYVTLKKSLVDPLSIVPYLMVVWRARSSTDSKGVSFLSSEAMKLTRLVMYSDMMISMKNHQTQLSKQVEMDLQTLLYYVKFGLNTLVEASTLYWRSWVSGSRWTYKHCYITSSLV